MSGIFRVFIFAVFSLLLHLPGTLFSQQIKFHHLKHDDKSGFGNVWAIQEDHEGFMWFGTEDGLYKYDGYEIKTFRYEKSNPGSISGNFIVCLFEDSNENLWIGTFGDGLNLYNREKNTFTKFKHNPADPHSIPNDRVKTIFESKDGALWIGTEGGGLAIYKPDSSNLGNPRFEIICHNPEDPNSLSSDYIRSMAEDKNGIIYVGTYNGGLNVINRKDNTIKCYKADKNDPDAIGHNKIMEVFVDSKNRIWMSTFKVGVDLFIPEEEKFIHYLASESPNTLNHNEVESITEDKDGVLWFGTDNGLSMMLDSHSPIPENNFRNFQHQPFDEYSLISNSAKCVYVDSRNSLWIGTYFGGINVYNRSLLKFHPIRNKPWLSKTLNNNIITAIEEDKEGNIWIGTDGGGINILHNGIDDPFKSDYETITLRNPITNRVEIKIKTLEQDQEGYIWAGVWSDGIYKIDPVTKKSWYYGPNDAYNTGLKLNNVLRIISDRKNNLWIGTFVQGITYFNPKTLEHSRYMLGPNRQEAFANERIHSIVIDSKDRVWIGGEIGGLNLYNEEENSFRTIECEGLLNKNTSILCLSESRDGKLWIGTVSHGAILYDPETNKAKSYTKTQGLTNSVLQAIIEDDSGRVWMSTNNGIDMYDPEKQKFTSYTKADGLQGNQFNPGSACKSSNGYLFFGGTNGWNAIIPDSIKTYNVLPKIAFTNFWLKSELMNVNDPGSPLTADINSNAEIRLNHDQNSFSIEFAALDYNFHKNNKYAYRLIGLDPDWQDIGGDRKISFTKLKPKRYELWVKATNMDGVWTERKEPLIIIISPAWYQTIWFKIAFLITVGILIFLIFRLRIKFLINQSRKLEEEVQVRTAQLKMKNLELHDKTNEILAQNEELSAQNDQIEAQRNKLEIAKEELKTINDKLEKIVNRRTKKLKSTIKKLDKTVLELDRFVYSASHDLSAPLKSIRGLIQIAKIEEDPARVHECFKYIENSIIRLEAVIQSLVEYSRNTHLELDFQEINIYELANEVISELAFWPEASKINIINAIKKTMVAYTDKPRLKIVLHNLISNGIKYADFDKIQSDVRIMCTQKEHSWILRISDNGIGIDKKDFDNIFEMYFRASEKSQGSGLGLFIVKETIHRLQGKIKVESEKGSGTTFLIEFPNTIKINKNDKKRS